MYIRRVSNKHKNKEYFTYKLVESIRTSRGPRVQILLNLGHELSVPSEDWKALANRIEELVTQQDRLLPLEPYLEELAQKFAKQLIRKLGKTLVPKPSPTAAKPPHEALFETIDLDSLQQENPRTIGGEAISLAILNELNLQTKLIQLGFTVPEVKVALALIIARLLAPGSERASHRWLQEVSGLDELLDADFKDLSLSRLYRVGDRLLSHKEELETYLYQKETQLFNLSETLLLYDLTNTYFEGSAKANPKAAFGHSKEKRSDCPLVTLGLVLDAQGFPKRSLIHEGNVSEPKTLEVMLQELQIPGELTRPIVVLDAGIATQSNLSWLNEHGYHYLVVARNTPPLPASDQTGVVVKEVGQHRVNIVKHFNVETGEWQLFCHSTMKEKKEQGMLQRFQQRMENDLTHLQQGLQLQRTTKDPDKIHEKIGRLRQRHQLVSSAYEIVVIKNTTGKKAIALYWHMNKDHLKKSYQGLYCLRTNLENMDEKTLWQTYTLLTEVEDAFRSMKSELGLRPIFHQKEQRVDGHLFITLLAFHVLHSLRHQLKLHGIDDRWSNIRLYMSTQVRITAAMNTSSGKRIHVRQASRPSAFQQQVYQVLNLPDNPGGRMITYI